jgi:phospholipid/cholesterol/gamma-HCH transport system ATP-binding protein
MTTVINTHDMNSVMAIGENIVLLHQGQVAWHGTKDEVFSSTNQILYDFVFASPFLQKVRDLHFEGEGQ